MTTPQLSDFLKRCVKEEVVDEKTAVRLQRYARSVGCGVVEAVEDLGLMSRGQFVERVLHALSAQRTYYPLLLQRRPGPSRSFDNFYPFKSHYPPVNGVKALVEGRHPSIGVGPYILLGDHGMGKTHLLCAAVKKVCGDDAVYYHALDLEAEIERAGRLQSRADLRQTLSSVRFLALDDFHRLEGNKELQREVLAILEGLIAEEKAILIASSVPPEEMKALDEELRVKVSGGVRHTLEMGEEEERRVLLEKLDGAEKLKDEVRLYLAANMKESVRHMKAALLQIGSMCGGRLEDASVEVARAVVPLPKDLDHRTHDDLEPVKSAVTQQPSKTDDSGEAARFKKMMSDAENEEEQALALQIALNQRLRELREAGEHRDKIKKFEGALELLRSGDVEEAIKSIATETG